MAQAAVQTEWSGMFTKGQWHYTRSSFAMAGQDSFTQPPGQSEDLFVLLLNVLPPVQGNLQRRWGYSQLNTGLFSTPPASQVSVADMYINFSTNLRYQIWNAGQQISAFDEQTNIYNPSIFVPQGAPVRSVSSRGFQYFASGFEADLVKWDGSQTGGVSKWGIDISGATPSGGGTAGGSYGPNAPGTVTDLADASPLIPWTTPTNVEVFADGNYATASPKGGVQIFIVPVVDDPTNTLQMTNFSFTIPTGAQVTSISVQINGKSHSGQATAIAQLVNGGVPVGLTASVTLPKTSAVQTFNPGSSNPTWGLSLFSGDVDSSTFGVNLVVHARTAGAVHTDLVSIDGVQITVVVGPTVAGFITLGAPAAGAITLVSGRVYFIVANNSTTGHFSDLSPPSASTGPLTSEQIPLSGIPVFPDPQVNTIYILATADGGDETLLYLLATIPNGTTTYTDNIPDTQLVLNNVYLTTDVFGTSTGVADNTPPPAGLLFPIAHRGRIYGAIGPQLFFSKSEAELLTTTGTLTGKFEEAWPGENYFTVTIEADEITGLLSDGQVLYVGTTSRVVRLFGDGPDTFTEPETLFLDVGVLNQDVWKMVFVQGNPLGAIWLTPDYKVLGSDFNTYQNVGVPVQDVLNNINRGVAASTCWSSFVANGIYNLYVLAVPTGNNTQPDTLLIFDLTARQWFTWQLADFALGGLFNITQAGIPTFNFQGGDGTLFQLGPQAAQDRIGTPTPALITSTITTSFISLVDTTARKFLNEVEIATGDPSLLVSVSGASTAAEFLSPRAVVTSAPLVTKPRGELAVMLAAAPALDRYYQYSFTSTSLETDLLSIVSVEGGILHRV